MLLERKREWGGGGDSSDWINNVLLLFYYNTRSQDCKCGQISSLKYGVPKLCCHWDPTTWSRCGRSVSMEPKWCDHKVEGCVLSLGNKSRWYVYSHKQNTIWMWNGFGFCRGGVVPLQKSIPMVVMPPGASCTAWVYVHLNYTCIKPLMWHS